MHIGRPDKPGATWADVGRRGHQGAQHRQPAANPAASLTALNGLPRPIRQRFFQKIAGSLLAVGGGAGDNGTLWYRRPRIEVVIWGRSSVVVSRRRRPRRRCTAARTGEAALSGRRARTQGPSRLLRAGPRGLADQPGPRDLPEQRALLAVVAPAEAGLEGRRGDRPGRAAPLKPQGVFYRVFRARTKAGRSKPRRSRCIVQRCSTRMLATR